MTFYNEKGKHDFKNRLPIIEIVSVTTKMKNLESSQQLATDSKMHAVCQK